MLFNKDEKSKIKTLHDSFIKDRLEYNDFFEKIKVGTKMKELRGHHAGQNFVVKKVRPSGGRLNFMIEYDDGQEYSAYSDDLWDDYKANKLVFADSKKIFSEDEKSKIKKLHDSIIKDSDALAKLAYEFGQMGSYFDRANSPRSREILASNDEAKYKEFVRKAIQVKAQLQKDLAGMKKGMKSEQKLGWYKTDKNKTVRLLEDGIERLAWISYDMRDNSVKRLADELKQLLKEYENLLEEGPETFDSKAKDAQKVYEIHWIDQYQKAKGWAKDFWSHDDQIKANSVTEALEKLKNIAVMRGVGTNYIFVVNIKENNSNYMVSGKVDKVINELRDSKPKDSKVKDGRYVRFNGKSQKGYEIKGYCLTSSGRMYAVIYRPNVGDYLVAAGYNQQRGDWDQGYYDFKTEEQAAKKAEQLVSMYDSKPKDSKVKDYSYNPHKEISAVERFLSGYNSMVAGIEKALKTDPASAKKLFDKLNKEYEYAEQATGIITTELPKQMDKIYDEMDALYEEIQEQLAIK